MDKNKVLGKNKIQIVLTEKQANLIRFVLEGMRFGNKSEISLGCYSLRPAQRIYDILDDLLETHDCIYG